MTYEEALAKHGTTRYERLRYAKSLGTHTKLEWEIMKHIHDYVCAKCGSEVIGGHPCKDHIVPILWGGSDAIENLQPLCRECNTQKRERHSSDYRKPWKRKMKALLKLNS